MGRQGRLRVLAGGNVHRQNRDLDHLIIRKNGGYVIIVVDISIDIFKTARLPGGDHPLKDF
jgi:hypothetical protein